LEKGTIIDYSGSIHYETIGELIHEFKNHVHILGVHIATYKKVLLVMIESLENIMKYGAYPPSAGENDPSVCPEFTIMKDGDRYFVTSSNSMDRRNVPELEARLAYLNTLTPQGVKEFYKETITNGEFTQQGGAGLGLIEMVKISGNKVDYDFHPVDDHYTTFRLKITIDEFPSYPQNDRP